MPSAVIAGVGMTQFGRFLERSLRSLSEEAARKALDDAGIAPGDLGMVFFGNGAAGLLTGQECVRGQVMLRYLGIQGKPVVNVENACASSSTAFHLARMAIESGQCDIALAMGAEKMYNVDRTVPIKALMAAADLDELAELKVRIQSPENSSLFMDLYSNLARAYMDRTGATVEDFADMVVKSRTAAALNENAQFRDRVTRGDVLQSKIISPPLGLMMCSAIGDGAAAVILMSEAEAKRRGVAAVKIRGSVLMSGQGDIPGARPVAEQAARKAYELTGVGPDDLDVVELHDAAAPAEFWLTEQIQLAPDGGVALFRSGATALGGRIPVNPSGGLLSRGHPIGATGAAQLVELANQLRGRCGARQCENARLALAENGGGWIGDDAAATMVTILEA